MKGKVLLVIGFGVGYVLGARAGRKRYEQIVSVVQGVWENPLIQKQTHKVQDYAADRIGDIGGAVTERIKRTVTGSKGSAARAAAETGTADGATKAPASGATGRSAESGAS
jgi:hypothetical protein